MPARARACGGGPRDVAPSSRMAPRIGPERAGDQVEQRRLAGAVRADDAERVALGDGEIDAVRDLDRAEGSAEALELEDHVSDQL